uniref:Uncharacterized protein n=1 Tax=Romanomermis culicivorax TaxID=13658 RepID=A0A915ICD9_ROMCU
MLGKIKPGNSVSFPWRELFIFNLGWNSIRIIEMEILLRDNNERKSTKESKVDLLTYRQCEIHAELNKHSRIITRYD